MDKIPGMMIPPIARNTASVETCTCELKTCMYATPRKAQHKMRGILKTFLVSFPVSLTFAENSIYIFFSIFLSNLMDFVNNKLKKYCHVRKPRTGRPRMPTISPIWIIFIDCAND